MDSEGHEAEADDEPAAQGDELGENPIELAKSLQTLQQLLEELTLMGLADAQAERTNQPLSQSDIDAQAEEGRVRFAGIFCYLIRF